LREEKFKIFKMAKINPQTIFSFTLEGGAFRLVLGGGRRGDGDDKVKLRKLQFVIILILYTILSFKSWVNLNFF
jgi:hypothetical protein